MASYSARREGASRGHLRNGSELRILREDADFTLSRLVSADSEGRLLLVAVSDQPSVLALLVHEYSIRARLDAACSAQPIELVRHEGRPALSCIDPGGQLLEDKIGAPWEITAFLGVGIAVAASLSALHAHEVIHKDIKPANVLVNESTGEAWFLGFGFASLARGEEQSALLESVVAGTLAYMAPEQTGRTKRSVDFRSDLYSLGITLYEMLTGGLPFKASDPMEWVHCHLARRPPHPSEIGVAVPDQIAAIVLKLLNKAPEDRYQTAHGLEADLRRCRDCWTASRSIPLFQLAANDVSSRLLVPQKLYGRDGELAVLRSAFDRVASAGTPELALITGPSGVGKSALISVLEASLAPERCLFAAGKFDQYKGDVPYATLAQALQRLVRMTLARSEEELARWRSGLALALGQNGQLFINLVPELELVIGKQPPVPELPPPEAQNRYKRQVCRLLGVFATRERPLVLVLDDLQWADPATLDLLEYLFADAAAADLLVLGAYRDTAVAPNRELARTIGKLEEMGAAVTRLTLAPLGVADLTRLLADTFACVDDQVESVAHIIGDKTGGNPFFVRQLLVALHDDQLVAFDRAARSWTWDALGIASRRATDNVVELTVARLNGLSSATRLALTTLACLGSGASVADVGAALGAEPQAVHEALAEAVKAGVLLRVDGSYSFRHDRLQQASYELLSPDERARLHLEIGRSLLQRTVVDERESAVFGIVNQLNRGAAFLSSRAELDELCELNLIAGKRARGSSAYASAHGYFKAGRAALSAECWDATPGLVFELELHHAECEYLTGEFGLAEEHLATLAQRAPSLVQLATVARVRITLYTTLYDYERATQVCLDYLARAGMTLSAHPAQSEVQREYHRIWQQIGERAIETLALLPRMEDAELGGTMEVLSELQPIASVTERNLVDLVIGRMINLSLQHGHWDGACLSYLQFALVLSARNLASHATTLRFGRLSWALAQRGPVGRFRGRFYMMFGCCMAPWIDSLRTARGLLERALELSLESGDVTFAVYSALMLTDNFLAAGDHLEDVQRKVEAAMDLARRAKFGLFVEALNQPLKLTRMLRGQLPEFGRLDDPSRKEGELEAELERSAHFYGYSYWVFKLMSRVLVSEHASALAAAEKAAAILRTTPIITGGLCQDTVEYHFFAALSHAALHDDAPLDQRAWHVAELTRHHAQVSAWADSCAENFTHRAFVLGAELARIQGRALDAEHLYEDAIVLARQAGFIQIEAIGAERAALFYLGRRLSTIAQTYLRQARTAYAQWGADGKVRHLDRIYPELRERRASTPSSPGTGETVEGLDVAAALKMSQAVSSEIELGALIDRLMTIALEHAGAERGLLIRVTEKEVRVEAEATTSQSGISVHSFIGTETRVVFPDSVVRFVVRKHEAVILDDARLPNLFSSDRYLLEAGARSVLCLPLLKQAQLSGVLYLENGLSTHVFTPARIAILGMLASQAAISLENARLYLALRAEIQIRQQAEVGLKRSEAYLAEAQTLSRTGSFGWNATTQELVCSTETCRLLGLDPLSNPTPEEVRSRIHPDDLESVTKAFEDWALQGERYVDYEHRVVLPNGSVKRIHVVARGAPNARGEVEFVGAAMDVTEQRQAQADLEKSEEALNSVRSELAHVARVTSLGVLTASIAHEVSQPLSGVVTNASACLRMLAADPPNLDGARETARRMIRDGNRAADVIRRLRALFGKKGVTNEPLDLNEATREVIALSLKELQKNRVTLRTELAAELPLVNGDRVQLQQVVLNLLLNASDAMSEVVDRPRQMVVRTQAEEHGRVRLSVEDTGLGIESESLARLFEAFYSTKSGGMGIGLSVSRSIIENHQGTLWGAPNEGPGATFAFSVPSGDPAESARYAPSFEISTA